MNFRDMKTFAASRMKTAVSSMKTFSVSRRTAIFGIAAAGTALTLTAGFEFLRREEHEHALLRKIIEKNMPSIQVADEDIVRLHKDIYELEYNLYEDARRKKFKLVSAIAVFAEPRTFFERVGRSDQLEVLERTVITYFILGSDFLDQKEPNGATISYSGYEPTCGNPFTRGPV